MRPGFRMLYARVPKGTLMLFARVPEGALMLFARVPEGARRLWLLSLSLLVAASGCSELVSLGSDCPDDNRGCLALDDGGKVDARPADAGALQPADAGVSTAVPDAANTMMSTSVVFPIGPDGNGGFELSSGTAGELTTLSSTEIAPWYTCQPIGSISSTTAVRAESSVTLSNDETPAGAVVSSSDGSATFVSMQYLINLVPIPLVQALSTPLEPGVRYGFAIDVQSPNLAAQLSLQVRGTGTDDDCINLGGNLLVESDPITTPGWRTLCLPFTTTVERTHLVLTVKSGTPISSALMNASARLLIDNMRPATAALCPNL